MSTFLFNWKDFGFGLMAAAAILGYAIVWLVERNNKIEKKNDELRELNARLTASRHSLMLSNEALRKQRNDILDGEAVVTFDPGGRRVTKRLQVVKV